MSWFRALFVAVPLVFTAASAKAEVKVVTTLPPLHSLADAVMGDTGSPTLLLSGSASPHGFALRPSAMKAIADADLLFMMDEQMETFMVSALDATGQADKTVMLFDTAPIAKLTMREGGVWDAHDHGDEDAHDDHDHHDHGAFDGHAWLNAMNGAVFAQVMAHHLIKLDPENEAVYRANSKALVSRLVALDGEIKAQLAPIADRPHVVFHDAYQYFQNRYGLNTVGSVTVSPERKPGAKQLSRLRRKIVELEAVCLFSEPQFRPAIVRSIAGDTGVATGELDPLGAALKPGPDLYETMLRNMAASFRSCLDH